MTGRTAQSFGNAGIVLIILAVVIPMAWVGLDVRWFLALGLLLAGGICTGVSRWLLREATMNADRQTREPRVGSEATAVPLAPPCTERVLPRRGQRAEQKGPESR